MPPRPVPAVSKATLPGPKEQKGFHPHKRARLGSHNGRESGKTPDPSPDVCPAPMPLAISLTRGLTEQRTDCHRPDLRLRSQASEYISQKPARSLPVTRKGAGSPLPLGLSNCSRKAEGQRDLVDACQIQSPHSSPPPLTVKLSQSVPRHQEFRLPNYISQRAARALPVVPSSSARDCGCWAGIPVLPYRLRWPQPGLATRNLPHSTPSWNLSINARSAPWPGRRLREWAPNFNPQGSARRYRTPAVFPLISLFVIGFRVPDKLILFPS